VNVPPTVKVLDAEPPDKSTESLPDKDMVGLVQNESDKVLVVLLPIAAATE
jgi:hypothetical protein